MTSIAITSGKGGVGKTTIALNMALVLSKIGKRVVIIDADVAMANLGIMLGIDRTPVSLHNVLMGEMDIKDVVYKGPAGLFYVPSELSLQKYFKLNFSKLKEAVKKLEKDYDYVIIDCPPGLGEDAKAALESARTAIIVLTPDPSALADALKMKHVSEHSGTKNLGIIVNMITKRKSEIRAEDLETVSELKVLASIPEDPVVRDCGGKQKPLILTEPNSPAALKIREFAMKLAGIKATLPAPSKKGLLSKIIQNIKHVFKR